jgi:hypothetical protein
MLIALSPANMFAPGAPRPSSWFCSRFRPPLGAVKKTRAHPFRRWSIALALLHDLLAFDRQLSESESNINLFFEPDFRTTPDVALPLCGARRSLLARSRLSLLHKAIRTIEFRPACESPPAKHPGGPPGLGPFATDHQFAPNLLLIY